MTALPTNQLREHAAQEIRAMLLEDLAPSIADQVKPYEIAMLTRAFLRGWTAHARAQVRHERGEEVPA